MKYIVGVIFVILLIFGVFVQVEIICVLLLLWLEKVIIQDVDIDVLVVFGEDFIQVLQLFGEDLFIVKFIMFDGVGCLDVIGVIVLMKVCCLFYLMFQWFVGLDVNVCVLCYNEFVIGGVGLFMVNVFVFEGFESVDFDIIDL